MNAISAWFSSPKEPSTEDSRKFAVVIPEQVAFQNEAHVSVMKIDPEDGRCDHTAKLDGPGDNHGLATVEIAEHEWEHGICDCWNGKCKSFS